jgi:hypothetical protein
VTFFFPFIAALLHFPRLRRAVGAFILGTLFLVVMTAAFGSAGAIIAVVLALMSLYRPL